jgi:hypothetical protein
MAKTARQHLQADKQSKAVLLDKDFAGVKKGSKLFVATPMIVDRYIRNIPYGETRTIIRLRNELAQRNQCDASCPVSTAIFIRIAAQASIDELAENKPIEKVTPFWRLLSSEDKIAKKLSIDGAWIDHQRELEKSN